MEWRKLAAASHNSMRVPRSQNCPKQEQDQEIAQNKTKIPKVPKKRDHPQIAQNKGKIANCQKQLQETKIRTILHNCPTQIRANCPKRRARCPYCQKQDQVTRGRYLLPNTDEEHMYPLHADAPKSSLHPIFIPPYILGSFINFLFLGIVFNFVSFVKVLRELS